MQIIKVLFQAKVLRWLALGLVLFASLLLLIPSRYGSLHLVAVGTISRDPSGGGAIIDIMAAQAKDSQAEIAVSASSLLLRNIEQAGEDAQFLAVVNQRGEKLVFERIFLLTAPEDLELQGEPESKNLGLAVGSKPELVEMVGLDRFGYKLAQPIWAKEKMPGCDKVYHQQGNPDLIKDILDGNNGDFVPNLFLLDGEHTVVGLRRLGQRLLPLPELMRRAAIWLYGLSLVAALGSLLSYKWSILVSAGKRIWDHVSKWGRRAAN